MAGSTYGQIFKITTWGESHGKALGVVIDGCPAGFSLSEEDIQPFLNRRKPGQSSITTPRKEDDHIEILSGTFQGKTTGSPIMLMLQNTSQHSGDYDELSSCFRPGHADYTFDAKYGIRDYRGGGRSSGRETAGRVAAGAVAAKLLRLMGIELCAYTRSIGNITVPETVFNKEEISQNPVYMPSAEYAEKAMDYLEECRRHSDSAGGVVECVVTGCPAGVGDPVFEKLDANLAKALMSIGAVKAVEIGDGIKAAKARGSVNNDCFYMKEGTPAKETNHAGGILGGISDGSPIILKTHIKPTPSIFQEQKTVTKNGEDILLNIKGRHDPVIVPRAVVVVEAMTALTILDSLLINMSAKAENVIEFYKR